MMYKQITNGNAYIVVTPWELVEQMPVTAPQNGIINI